jgi:hypothetical protein
VKSRMGYGKDERVLKLKGAGMYHGMQYLQASGSTLAVASKRC